MAEPLAELGTHPLKVDDHRRLPAPLSSVSGSHFHALDSMNMIWLMIFNQLTVEKPPSYTTVRKYAGTLCSGWLSSSWVQVPHDEARSHDVCDIRARRRTPIEQSGGFDDGERRRWWRCPRLAPSIHEFRHLVLSPYDLTPSRAAFRSSTRRATDVHHAASHQRPQRLIVVLGRWLNDRQGRLWNVPLRARSALTSGTPGRASRGNSTASRFTDLLVKQAICPHAFRPAATWFHAEARRSGP